MAEIMKVVTNKNDLNDKTKDLSSSYHLSNTLDNSFESNKHLSSSTSDGMYNCNNNIDSSNGIQQSQTTQQPPHSNTFQFLSWHYSTNSTIQITITLFFVGIIIHFLFIHSKYSSTTTSSNTNNNNKKKKKKKDKRTMNIIQIEQSLTSHHWYSSSCSALNIYLKLKSISKDIVQSNMMTSKNWRPWEKKQQSLLLQSKLITTKITTNINNNDTIIACLNVLASKCSKGKEVLSTQISQTNKRRDKNSNNTPPSTNNHYYNEIPFENLKHLKQEQIILEDICLKASFLVLRLQDQHQIINHNNDNNNDDFNFDKSDDRITIAAVRLLALIAGNILIRRKHLYNSNGSNNINNENDIGNDIGSYLPIRIVRRSLQEAKQIACNITDDNNNDIKKNYQKVKHSSLLLSSFKVKERLAAELQRSLCLYLGALIDDTNDDDDDNIDSRILTSRIINNGGLHTILDALNWYRFHAGVANWGCWAIFILLCNITNDTNNNNNTTSSIEDHKREFVNADGIYTMCRIMKDHATNVMVGRHAVAVLFDLLRDDKTTSTKSDNKQDRYHKNDNNHREIILSRNRLAAINAGMHHSLVEVMTFCSNSKEILMMGTQMLICTGYSGNIPTYIPT